MPERTLIPTALLAVSALVSAGLLQLFLIWTLGTKVGRVQIVGMVGVSAILGGCATVLGQEYMHWNSFLAGVIGTLTGMVPAAISSSIITRKAMAQAGMTPEDVSKLLTQMRGPEGGETK